MHAAAVDEGVDTMQAICLTIPAKPEYITLGRLALAGLALLRPEQLSPEVVADVKLALTEAGIRRRGDDCCGHQWQRIENSTKPYSFVIEIPRCSNLDRNARHLRCRLRPIGFSYFVLPRAKKDTTNCAVEHHILRRSPICR